MAESPDTPDLGWIKPLDAVAVCQRLFGLSEPASRRRLIFLARNDRILRTFCTHFQRRSFDGYENDDEYEDDTLLPGFWTGFDSSQWPSEDWQNGLFSFKTMDREDIAHGVRFSRLDLINYKRKLDGEPPLTSMPPPPAIPSAPQVSRAPAPSPELRARRQAAPTKEISLAELIRRHPELSQSLRADAPDSPMVRELKQERDALAREAFEGIVPAERPIAQKAEPESTVQKISAGSFADWYAQFAAKNPGAPMRVVRDAADAKFGKGAISRRRIYGEMGKHGKLSPGNPGFNRN